MWVIWVRLGWGSGWVSIWNHLGPEQSHGPLLLSVPRAVCMRRQVQRGQGREHGLEAWLLEQGLVYLVVLRAQTKLITWLQEVEE